MARVCHLSTVHDCFDNRIFYKQCRSLCDAGHEVTLVIQREQDEVIDGIRVLALPPTKSPLVRWFTLGWIALWKALRVKADVYQFHDPELIPVGLILRLLGNPVIYDVHEDYVSSISQKDYLPSGLRAVIAGLAGAFESLLARAFHQIIAERYYAERFPHAVPVLNYPLIPDDQQQRCQRSVDRLLYTGKVHPARGSFEHAKLPGLVPDVTVHFLGKCAESLHNELLSNNTTHQTHLSFEGVGYAVPFAEIQQAYSQAWLAGLAIFPPNEHLDRKELTKLFEYMLYGLPIIASNFPTWREIVERHECGICVDPQNDQDIVAAVERLRNDEKLWEEMAQNGIRAVREQYSWSSQADILLELYETILASKAK